MSFETLVAPFLSSIRFMRGGIWFLIAGFLISCSLSVYGANGPGQPQGEWGGVLPGSTEEVTLVAASSGWKIGRDWSPPVARKATLRIACASNEAEAAQLVVRPQKALRGFRISVSALCDPRGAKLAPDVVELFRVRYVHIEQPSDKSGTKGAWPDPLPPLSGSIDLEAGKNLPIWVRVTVPKKTAAGLYRGTLKIEGDAFEALVPLVVEVFGFALPDKMTCTTAFGFSPGNVWRYQNIRSEKQKRDVLDLYWANFAAHHISPYDPAPLDSIGVTWPNIKAPPVPWSKWQDARVVSNEKQEGSGALVIFDDREDLCSTVSYLDPIVIPKEGVRFSFYYRTALPGHRFLVTLDHLDAEQKWMSGCNRDISVTGDGTWQKFDQLIEQFPPGARFIRLRLRAALWSEAGEGTGLVWFDNVSLLQGNSGKELLLGGNFEKSNRTEPLLPKDQLQAKIDFSAWNKAMERAIDFYQFNSFKARLPGMGGGTFHELIAPSLLGFKEDSPEYPLLFDSYARQYHEHLSQKGWLDEAFFYWFDEPSPDQYAFVKNGFLKQKRTCPGIARMLTEQVEPALIGGPNIWCSLTNLYDHERAEERRREGEKFWWYVCTGPKAPYAGLFIDHPGTEMRVWLWQTYKRGIEGILVWDTNYWTSSVAYPDAPQDPYADPMAWRSGYSTPVGEKHPWGNGDGRFIYPPESFDVSRNGLPILTGPVDSIRWEMLRDGIEDYEYMVILQRLLDEKKSRMSEAEVRRVRDVVEVPQEISKDLTSFTLDPVPIETHRAHLAKAIVKLLAMP